MNATHCILELLDGVKPSGKGWTARCPAHDDRRASLSIAEGEDGRVLLKCHAGCECPSIVKVLGLQESDLFEPKQKARRAQAAPKADQPKPWTRPIEAAYDYCDESGKLLFQTIRFADQKDFAQRRPDPSAPGRWRWSLGDVRRVLFRLPDLRGAIEAGRTIYVVEGEKDALALANLGLGATTSPMGAGSWRTEYSDLLAGVKRIVVIPDNDEPGEKHARAVIASVRGKVGEAILLRLEGLPPKGDVSDWLAAGHTAAELEALAARPAEDGDDLMRELTAFVRRYVVMTDDQVTVVALWIVHTYSIEAAEATPYLVACSPEKRSGKSRLMEVLKVLVPDPWPVVRPSEAVLFRKIAKGNVTLLIDEFDTVFSTQKNESQEGVRAILNAGYERGASIPRCVGKDMKIEDFAVFCPKALFGIGDVPDTVRDRSFVIQMRRRKRTEECERFRRRDLGDAPVILRSRIASWAAAQMHQLRGASPALPDELNDRAQDAAEPLLAIAELIGGQWPVRASKALVGLAGESDEESDSIGHQLLADIRVALDRLSCTDDVSTQDLIRELLETDGPWKRYHRNEPLEAADLARLLKPYRIKPRKFRRGSETPRGYSVAQFREAFDRYLKPLSVGQSEQDGTSEQEGAGGPDSVPPWAEQEMEHEPTFLPDPESSDDSSGWPGTETTAGDGACSSVPGVPVPRGDA